MIHRSLKGSAAYFGSFVISEFFKVMAGFLGLKGSFCSLSSRKFSLFQAFKCLLRFVFTLPFGVGWVGGYTGREPRASHLLDKRVPAELHTAQPCIVMCFFKVSCVFCLKDGHFCSLSQAFRSLAQKMLMLLVGDMQCLSKKHYCIKCTAFLTNARGLRG